MNDRNKIFNVRVMLVVWYIFECRFYLYVSPCLFFLLKVKNKRNKKNQIKRQIEAQAKSHLPTINLITMFSLFFMTQNFISDCIFCLWNEHTATYGREREREGSGQIEREMNKIISFSCSRAIEIYSFALFLFSFIRWRVNFCAQMCTWDLVAIWMTEKYTGNTINSAYSYKSQKVKGSRQTNNPKRQY